MKVELPVPNSPYGLYDRKATLNTTIPTLDTKGSAVQKITSSRTFATTLTHGVTGKTLRKYKVKVALKTTGCEMRFWVMLPHQIS